jgi:prevent-host-death family protein
MSIPTESRPFSEARSTFSSLVDRVFRQEARVRLYKGSTPVAAVVSIADLERLERLDHQREADVREMAKLGEGFRDIPEDELEAKIYEITARVRREMWDERQASVGS